MRKTAIHTYGEATEYLLRIPRFTAKHTIEETKAFLNVLGSPDRQLRIVHVAGTNGKGSVCAYLRSLLEAAGKRVAVFTSPHLVDIRERFLIEGKMPSEEEFLSAFLAVYEKLDWDALEAGGGYHPTFFEYLFFMAMLLFAKAKPDYCILETGLGGRLDATNSVSHKELAVITRISLDHTEYLGDTVALIAGEKAGILAAGAPVVYSDTVPEASEVIEKRAEELQIPTYPVSNQDYTILKIMNKTIDFLWKYRYHKNIEVSLHTIALYQVENASVALCAAGLLEPLTEEQMRDGLRRCFWAGRMEEVLPEVYVDGAHNSDGIRAFLETVAADGWEADRWLLFSAVSDKDYEKMLGSITASGLFARIALVQLQTGRGVPLRTLQAAVEKCGKRPDACCGSAEEALEAMLAAGKGKRIYIAGSLYLAGEIRACAARLREAAEMRKYDQF